MAEDRAMQTADVSDQDLRADERSSAESDGPFHPRFIWFLTLLSGAVLWLRPLPSSLWLDELVTWWVVKDSFSDAIHRAYDFQGQSIAYYVVAWLTRHIGSAEWVLRLPSLAAMTLAAYLMYRLARRLLDREYARLTVFFFVLWPGLVFEASNARPYAIAILLVVASALALVRWLDRPTVGRLVAFAAFAAAIGYAHILYVFVLPAFLLYAIVRVRDGSTTARTRSVVGAFGLVAAIDVGLLWQGLALLDRRDTINLPSSLSIDWLANVITPTSIVAALVVGGGLAWLVRPWRLHIPEGERASAILVLAWLFVPFAIEAGLALTTQIHLLEVRYALMAVPAMVLVAAALLRSVAPPESRRIIAAILAIAAVVTLGGRLKYGEDWRWAASTADGVSTPHTVVLLQPGLVESAQLDWFRDPERLSYLEAPASYYSFDARIVPVPYVATPDALAFLDRELSQLPADTDRVLFVTRYNLGEFHPYLDGWLQANGWSVGPVRTDANMVVAEYDRA